MKSKALRVKTKAVRVWHESGLIFSERGFVCRRVGIKRIRVDFLARKWVFLTLT